MHDTSYLIRRGLSMPCWYPPKLLVRPARGAASAAPTAAAPDYRTAYAIHSAALPIGATPALPAPANATAVGVPAAPGPTGCNQPLTWSPNIVVLETRASERIVKMALHPRCPEEPTNEDLDSARVPEQAHPVQAATSYPGTASAKGETETGSLSATTPTDEGRNRDARPHAVMQTTSNPGRSAVHGPARDAANVMVVKRDANDSQQRSKSSRKEIDPTRRLVPPDTRAGHSRAAVFS